MATAIQRRRGTTAQHGSFTGLAGEITVDTDKKTAVVHDGSTAGGFPLLRNTVSATDKLLGRSTAGAGAVEEIACTAAGRALLDDATAAVQRATLGVDKGALFLYDAAPVDGTVVWAARMPCAGTVDSLTWDATSGSVTVAVKINGTDITSLSAVAVSSSGPTTTNATGANTFAIGDRVTLVYSSASTPVGVELALNITKG
jgi:hypothetical protein